MKIWHLDFELDEYDNLVPVNELSLDEVNSYDGSSKVGHWKPIVVKKMEDKKLSNAPGFYSHIPVFDKYALEALNDLVMNSIEALPMLCSKGEFYLINITKVIEGIDYEKSEYKTFRDGKRIMRFIKYEFIEDMVKGKHIFKIVDEPLRRPFVSDEFKQRVSDCHLTGFKFELAWDNGR